MLTVLSAEIFTMTAEPHSKDLDLSQKFVNGVFSKQFEIFWILVHLD